MRVSPRISVVTPELVAGMLKIRPESENERMKDKRVVFDLYGIRFESRPMTQETAEEMLRQLRDRDVKDCKILPALPREMYMILKVDQGDGFHRVDSAGLQVWPNPDVAREEKSRWMYSTGYTVVPVEVCTEPRSLGTAEQQAAWKARNK